MREICGKLWRISSVIVCAAILAAGCAMPSSSGTGPRGSAAKTVSTLAGQPGLIGSSNGTGSGATFFYPAGVVVAGGSLYIADSSNSTIRRLDLSTNAVTTFAGVPGVAGYFDNASYPGLAAYFNVPEGITADGAGNLYVADSGNNVIRKVVIVSGAVSTLAGNPNGQPGSSDGTGANASFNNPLGICYDGVTNLLYVADSGNSTIREVTTVGGVTTIAGNANAQGSTDGPGSFATFTWTEGVAIDSTNTNLYVVDTGNGTIRKITIPGFIVSTLAGQPGAKGDADGTGQGANFNWPEGIAIDNTNTNLYVADTVNSTIRQVVISSGAVTTLAGQGGVTGSANGAGNVAAFNHPMRLVFNSPDLYVADTYNETIRQVQ